MSVLKAVAIFVVALVALLLVLWAFAPRDEIPTQANHESRHVPSDLTELPLWLQNKESVYADILPGVEKQIVWADSAAPSRTEWSVVYLHGFSATLAETRPMPDQIARELGANLYFTRLRGHGRGSDAMLDGSLQSWLDDTAEAIEIGRTIGEKVLVIGVSTGGTLAALAAAEGHFKQNVAGWVFISPNFKVKAAGSGLLTGPWAKSWVPMLLGETRSWEPLSEEHARYWTTTYSNLALLPMAASVKAAAEIDYSALTEPALFIFSDADQVVDESKTREIAANWGGEAELMAVKLGPDDDPYHHVIAGDILSPSMTMPLARAVVVWARELAKP